MKFSRLAVTFVSLLIWHAPAYAIVTEPDASGVKMPLPSSDYVARWGLNASGFAVSPRLLITSAHGWGGAWGVTIAGEYRLICSWEKHPSADPSRSTWGLDVGVAKLCNDQQDFPGFYPIHRGTPAAGRSLLLGGAGLKRGPPIVNTPSQSPAGYSTNPNSSREVTYGLNLLDYFAVNPFNPVGSYTGPDLYFDFSPPSAVGAQPYESGALEFDSGGLIAVSNRNRWEAIGLVLTGSNSGYYGAFTAGRALDRMDVLRWLKQFDSSLCLPDFDGSRTTNIDDIFVMLRRWFAAGYDYDDNGISTIDDIFIFLSDWFAGC